MESKAAEQEKTTFTKARPEPTRAKWNDGFLFSWVEERTPAHLWINYKTNHCQVTESWCHSEPLKPHIQLNFSTGCCCSVSQPCLTLWDPMDCIMPGSPVHHHLLELAQTHVHWVTDAIQPSHPLSSPSPPAFNLFQHWGLFQWVSSSHKVAKILEF